MPASVLTTLEFDQVLERLSRHCQFSLAGQRAREIGPSSDPATVCYLIDVTRQAVDLLRLNPSFSVGGVRDISNQLQRAAINSMLTPADLLLVLDTVSACRRLRRSFAKIENRQTAYPALAEFIDHVADLPTLEANLQRSISDAGEVLDSASDTLRTIRVQLRQSLARAAERIRRYTQDSGPATALQEPIVTSRDGRYVVPVRADRRHMLPGVVHGTSASGQTLFVEPVEMVELNNRVRELQAAEQHEIERILTVLTAEVADAADPLTTTMDALSAIDLALAKARFAASLRAVEPLVADDGARQPRRLFLKRARHPLIPPEQVVPIDLTLGEDFRVLVITGPNTGGKTVALKTVGLLSLMAQSGLFIPADEGSELPAFDGVFADIGDEQSIEQNLSTFSSHMTRVIATLRNVSERSLVLFDELGAGTDPEEGAALARAIIQRLLVEGCLAVTTTHYSELKTFAYSTEGVENASVEFDVETLSPTYRLQVGVPGRSNALLIAQRLGLSADILETARSYIDPNLEQADVLLAEIKERHVAAEEARRRAELDRERAHQALAEAEERRDTIERETLADLEAELRDVRDTLRRVRRIPERLPEPVFQAEVAEARKHLDTASLEARRTARRRQVAPERREPFKVGDKVELAALGGEGEIVALAENGVEADVQMGAFKLRQPLRDLKKLVNAPTVTRGQRATAPRPTQRVDMELHLRGQRVGGIEPILDDYLDNAYLSNLPFVRIVHGKGTGALREAVHTFVSRHPLVKSWETPPYNEGGDGVTLVYLKES